MVAGSLSVLRNAAFLFLLAMLLRAQGVAPAPDSAERMEAGRARLSSGTEILYRIRLLPLASFPALPATILRQLEQRSCMVPQTYEARGPENVIRGAFEKQGSDDWAVLCSVNGATSLYVFFESRPDLPLLLRRQRDDDWLGAEIVGAYGSAWGISVKLPSQLRIDRALARGQAIDHSGIEDAFLERSSTVHYFRDGAWTTLGGN
jgi:hypothetical protein